ncbi:hypothetical protein [Thermithiobacillus plumbiphilus]|uniref:Uncharacterized protein n=1 Tax=Thermithiobacillus plumbiphilus TaxID=1729899 RepID=A0ABU9DB80_9PROT
MRGKVSGAWLGSRKVWLILALAASMLLTGWLLRPDPRVAALNSALESIPALRDYPYPFRVLRVEGPVAVVSTPRSPAMPAFRVIWAIHPELRQAAFDSPAYQAAQQEISQMQKLTRLTVEAQPGIEQVHWELDMDWLAQHAQSPQD